jgi:hypothetical protein
MDLSKKEGVEDLRYKGILLLCFIMMFTSCVNKKDKEWTESRMFKKYDHYTLIGKKGSLGFTYDDSTTDSRFYPNKVRKYTWHFWNSPNEEKKLMPGNKVKILGTSEDSKDNINVFEGAINTIDTIETSAESESVAKVPSTMSLPSKGIWRLDAYIDGNLFGSVYVTVH